MATLGQLQNTGCTLAVNYALHLFFFARRVLEEGDKQQTFTDKVRTSHLIHSDAGCCFWMEIADSELAQRHAQLTSRSSSRRVSARFNLCSAQGRWLR